MSALICARSWLGLQESNWANQAPFIRLVNLLYPVIRAYSCSIIIVWQLRTVFSQLEPYIIIKNCLKLSVISGSCTMYPMLPLMKLVTVAHSSNASTSTRYYNPRKWSWSSSGTTGEGVISSWGICSGRPNGISIPSLRLFGTCSFKGGDRGESLLAVFCNKLWFINL